MSSRPKLPLVLASMVVATSLLLCCAPSFAQSESTVPQVEAEVDTEADAIPTEDLAAFDGTNASGGDGAPKAVTNTAAANYNPYVLEGSTSVQPKEGQALPVRDGEPQAYITYKTPWEVYLTAAAIALLAILVIVLAVMGRNAGLTPDFVRAFLVVTIIFAALFLIAAGYSDEQAAPVYGILGTILGYLFGKAESEKSNNASQAQNTAPVASQAPAAPDATDIMPPPPPIQKET